MSRFRPRISAAGTLLERRPSEPAISVLSRPLTGRGPIQSLQPRALTTSPQAIDRRTATQRVGFLILCLYLTSASLNDWGLRLVGMKAYVSIAALFLVPLAWFASGSSLRSLGHRMGWCWAAFLVWMLIDTPFSVWRGGTVQMLTDYVPRDYMLFFYVTALTLSLRQCRILMHVNAGVALSTLLTCIAFGQYSSDGRYFVPGGAGLLGNSNEVAMILLLGIIFFVYLYSQNAKMGKIVAMIGIPVSVVYIMRTGSRGSVIAALGYGIVLLYVGRNRLRLVAIGAVLTVVAVALAPTATVERLKLLFGDDPAQNAADISAAQSQYSRIELLKRSVQETIHHPLFGVGPGQFAVQVSNEAKEKGEWAQWLGTHNSYTQISSECGVPAFLFYVAVVIGSITMNVRIWKAYRFQPGREDVASLSVALLAASVVYAVSAFFFHMAYGPTLPLLAGQTLALHTALGREIKKRTVLA